MNSNTGTQFRTWTGQSNQTLSRPQTTSYTSWRQSKEKEKNKETPLSLTSNDFPPLVTTVKNTVQAGPSLAARLAVAIKNDEEQVLVKRQLENKEKQKQREDNFDHILPMSQYARVRFLAEKRFKEEKKKEIEAEEHEYQWQISREMSREVFESEFSAPTMPYSNHLTTHFEDLHDDNNDTEE
jgi:hypothetical protein